MTMASQASFSRTWCRSLGVLLLWLCLLTSSTQRVLAQENGDDDDTVTEVPVTEPTTPEAFNIKVEAKERTTSSITVGWRVPKGYGVIEYEVISSKTSENATTFSGPLDSDEHQYLVNDLAINSEYKICVSAKVDPDEDIPEEEKEKCDVMMTIPIIQAKSLIILFGVLGYIALMILIGYCLWKRDTKKALAEMEDDEEEEKMKPNEQPQTYLGAPANNAPKSSIEDHDIPYITPPVEQLSPAEKDQYKKAIV